jgi:hypothetical protein
MSAVQIGVSGDLEYEYCTLHDALMAFIFVIFPIFYCIIVESPLALVNPELHLRANAVPRAPFLSTLADFMTQV